MGSQVLRMGSTTTWVPAGSRSSEAIVASLTSTPLVQARIRTNGGVATECCLPFPIGSAASTSTSPSAPSSSCSTSCLASSWAPDFCFASGAYTTTMGGAVRPRASPSLTPGTGGGKGGGLLDRPVIEKVAPGRESEFDLKKKKKMSPPYRVLLHNDNFNRREYVVQVLMKVIPGMTVDSAVNIMQEAHVNGLSVVIVCAQNEAEDLCQQLRANGLVSSIEPADGSGC